MTAIFLYKNDLTHKILEVCKGKNLCCAVAFWGKGAYKNLIQKSQSNAKIICEISMGGTSPDELEKLGAPDNPNLKFIPRLHAKVYISSVGAIISSANASSGGVGFDSALEGNLLEAGTFHEINSDAYKTAQDWFNQLFQNSDTKIVDEEALYHAKKCWTPYIRGSRPSESPKKNSIFDIIRLAPEKFSSIGFVFTSDIASKEMVEESKNNLLNTINHEIIEHSKIDDCFTNWQQEVEFWPENFIEFWQPQEEKPQIFMRKKIASDTKNGTIFSKESNENLLNDNFIEINLNKLCAEDYKTIKKIISKYGNKLFLNGEKLIEELLG